MKISTFFLVFLFNTNLLIAQAVYFPSYQSNVGHKLEITYISFDEEEVRVHMEFTLGSGKKITYQMKTVKI